MWASRRLRAQAAAGERSPLPVSTAVAETDAEGLKGRPGAARDGHQTRAEAPPPRDDLPTQPTPALHANGGRGDAGANRGHRRRPQTAGGRARTDTQPWCRAEGSHRPALQDRVSVTRGHRAGEAPYTASPASDDRCPSRGSGFRSRLCPPGSQAKVPPPPSALSFGGGREGPRLGTNGFRTGPRYTVWPALSGRGPQDGPSGRARRIDSEFPLCTRTRASTEHFACQTPSDSADGAASALPTPEGHRPTPRRRNTTGATGTLIAVYPLTRRTLRVPRD